MGLVGLEFLYFWWTFNDNHVPRAVTYLVSFEYQLD